MMTGWHGSNGTTEETNAATRRCVDISDVPCFLRLARTVSVKRYLSMLHVRGMITAQRNAWAKNVQFVTIARKGTRRVHGTGTIKYSMLGNVNAPRKLRR